MLFRALAFTSLVVDDESAKGRSLPMKPTNKQTSGEVWRVQADRMCSTPNSKSSNYSFESPKIRYIPSCILKFGNDYLSDATATEVGCNHSRGGGLVTMHDEQDSSYAQSRITRSMNISASWQRTRSPVLGIIYIC